MLSTLCFVRVLRGETFGVFGIQQLSLHSFRLRQLALAISNKGRAHEYHCLR